MWRMFAFNIHKKKPSVQKLIIHLEALYPPNNWEKHHLSFFHQKITKELYKTLQENSGILTDIPMENEILGISRGISEDIPRKHKIWFPRNFLGSVPKKKGRLVGLGRRTRSVPPSSAPPPFVDPEVLTAQLKDKDDRISLLETQMAAQQAGYEAQRRLNQQMMEMMQRMYPNEVFPDVPDP
ncbi:hypothetical protein DY000_02015379 [Brassica cretica]|uniref:Uncharacterized protein n=1 Tax=Brassica cretica TaxID=69181 RepID=A0ABQ7CXU8_BRACR|nr:hypothetical protein DY000_02015379 [Brassica cretica]